MLYLILFLLLFVFFPNQITLIIVTLIALGVFLL